MMFNRFPVDYVFVGERDGFAGRAADAALWRREAYRRGYAQGLLTRAERIAQGTLMRAVMGRPPAEVRL
jgi:hypothetical protein